MSAHDYTVVGSTEHHRGPVITLRTDEVRMPDGGTARRDVVAHPGAVGVVALDDEGRVVLLRQYRHPVGRHLWELPAGLRDVGGEPPVETARRELAEEAGLRADHIEHLVTALSSPGMSDERIVIYLARGLAPIPAAERSELVHEETDLIVERVDLAAACERIAAGEIENAMAVIGLLAAARRLGRQPEPPRAS